MVSGIENVDIAAKIMGVLLLRLKEEVERSIAAGVCLREMLGRDGLADAAVRLVQTAIKLEEIRASGKRGEVGAQAIGEVSSDALTDEDVAVLRALLPV